MDKIREFLKKNFIIIVCVMMVFILFKSCGDKTELIKVRKELETSKELINERTFTKEDFYVILQIEGLKSEKRMIQATDRKIFDVKRQTEIDNEIKILQEKLT